MYSTTSEQSIIVSSQSPRVRVNAGAGTGKTSTLVQYAEARPHSRGLYLAFNKSVRDEARRRFPANCYSSTFHAIAYASTGRQFRNAGKLVPAVSNSSVLHLIKDADTTRRFMRARLALQAIHEFTVSDETALMPSQALCDDAKRLTVSVDTLMSDALRIWSAMIDVNNRAVGINHDAYFKLWFLTSPRTFSKNLNYILVDEAQDLNVVANAVLKAQGVNLVYVGDSAQGIYAFRGASDCLEKFDTTESFNLTTSFRFGKNIADLANSLLSPYKQNPLKLVGANPMDYVGQLEEDLPYAVICRTNAGAFTAAAQAVRKGHSIHFVGGPSSFGFSRIRQAYSLHCGQMSEVKDPFLRALGSLDAVVQYADLVKDSELKSICKVVKQHGSDIPHLLPLFEQKAVQEPVAASGAIEAIYPAQCFIGTAHRVKGMEFGQVRLADDFPSLMDNGRKLKRDEVDPQEIHLLYVGITRASFIFEPSNGLKAALNIQPNQICSTVASKQTPNILCNTHAAANSLANF